MLTLGQRDEFRRFGILRVPSAIPSGDVEAMCDAIWQRLDHRYHIRRNDSESWKGQRINGTKDRPKSMTFEQVVNRTLCAILDELLGSAAWERAEHWGSLLVAFRESRDRWDVPHQGWHFDAPVLRSLPGLYGLRLFTCLAKLEHGGGATVAVAGSHRLAQDLAGVAGFEKIRSAEIRAALIQRHSWMKELCSFDATIDRVDHFMKTSTCVGDVELRVVELTGDPGDVILMHPVTMHAGSLNCSSVPRLVLSTTVYRRGVDWNALYAPERRVAVQ